ARQVPPLERRVCKSNFDSSPKNSGPNIGGLLPLTYAVCGHESGYSFWNPFAIIEKAGDPTGDEIGSPRQMWMFCPSICEIGFLLGGLPFTPLVGWIAANVRFPALILEIDLRLIE